MASRSTRITLLNNTSFTLKLLHRQLCGGDWTPGGWEPPSEVKPKTQGAWQTESGGLATGTAGWVKYQLSNYNSYDPDGDRCPPELVYIAWNNPFIWVEGTKPLDFDPTIEDPKGGPWPCLTADVPKGNLPCEPQGATFDFSLEGGSSSSQACRHELFMYGRGEQFPGGITFGEVVWYLGVIWPIHMLSPIYLQSDINLEFNLGLRQQGSVAQTTYSLLDATKGLRATAEAAGKPSLRDLFNFGHA